MALPCRAPHSVDRVRTVAPDEHPAVPPSCHAAELYRALEKKLAQHELGAFRTLDMNQDGVSIGGCRARTAVMHSSSHRGSWAAGGLLVPGAPRKRR
jgi:hypothetical protein